MINKKLQDAINAQINAELWSAYYYLSMSLDAERKALNGIANWFWVQWLEEQDHARIFQKYMGSQNAAVVLKPIDSVQSEWKSAAQMFEDTLEHEEEVTEMIHKIALLARDFQDFATLNRLQWFIDEQIEEEQQARDLIAALNLVGDNKYGLFAIDRQLAFRQYEKASEL